MDRAGIQAAVRFDALTGRGLALAATLSVAALAGCRMAPPSKVGIALPIPNCAEIEQLSLLRPNSLHRRWERPWRCDFDSYVDVMRDRLVGVIVEDIRNGYAGNWIQMQQMGGQERPVLFVATFQELATDPETRRILDDVETHFDRALQNVSLVLSDKDPKSRVVLLRAPLNGNLRDAWSKWARSREVLSRIVPAAETTPLKGARLAPALLIHLAMDATRTLRLSASWQRLDPRADAPEAKEAILPEGVESLLGEEATVLVDKVDGSGLVARSWTPSGLEGHAVCEALAGDILLEIRREPVGQSVAAREEEWHFQSKHSMPIQIGVPVAFGNPPEFFELKPFEAISRTMFGAPKCVYIGAERPASGDFDCDRCLPWDRLAAGARTEAARRVPGPLPLTICGAASGTPLTSQVAERALSTTTRGAR